MIALVGTYRGLRYVPRLLESVEKYVAGIDSFVFIDDSGDAETASKLSEWGEVLQIHKQGYNAAMRAAAARGAQEKDYAVWLEEDFYFTAPTDFTTYRDELSRRKNWAQICIQRTPYYDVEKQYGGIIQENRRRGKTFQRVGDYWEHSAFFSGNPSIWQPEVFEMGWPEGESSEARITRSLILKGYKFAITDAILCEHDGEHLGTNY